MTDALACARCERDLHSAEDHHIVTTHSDGQGVILHYHTHGECHAAAKKMYHRGGGGIRFVSGRKPFDNKKRK